MVRHRAKCQRYLEKIKISLCGFNMTTCSENKKEKMTQKNLVRTDWCDKHNPNQNQSPMKNRGMNANEVPGTQGSTQKRENGATVVVLLWGMRGWLVLGSVLLMGSDVFGWSLLMARWIDSKLILGVHYFLYIEL